jgi:hypothetical protein
MGTHRWAQVLKCQATHEISVNLFLEGFRYRLTGHQLCGTRTKNPRGGVGENPKSWLAFTALTWGLALFPVSPQKLSEQPLVESLKCPISQMKTLRQGNPPPRVHNWQKWQSPSLHIMATASLQSLKLDRPGFKSQLCPLYLCPWARREQARERGEGRASGGGLIECHCHLSGLP